MIEGKTKRIMPGPKTGTVILATKDELTGGDAAKKATIAGIAQHKTSQAANVFSLLKSNDIPVSFIEQMDLVSLLCEDCEMLPLELVMRRYAWGSFLKREPSFQPIEGKPHRFEEIRCDFYHKWSVVVSPLVETPQQMDENKARELYLKNGVWKEGVYTDPYLNITGETWNLHPAKIPFEASQPLAKAGPVCGEDELHFIVQELMLPTFRVLEEAWNKVETQHGPIALADMKIEVGRRKSDGKLIIADVIDNDSWRIWPGGDPSRQLDKQNFRDGHPLSMVANNYALVAELTTQFLAS